MAGPLNNSPAEIAQQLIINMGFGVNPTTYTTGQPPQWPVYSDSVPDSPDSVITVSDTLGRGKYGAAYSRLMLNGERQEYHGLIILVRAPTKSEVYDKARPLAIALDQGVYLNTVQVDGTTYYVFSTSRFGDVRYLGDEKGTKRKLVSINAMIDVRMSLQEVYYQLT
jgi:hypothetical protein